MPEAVQKTNYVKRGSGAGTKMLDSARYYTYRAGPDRDERTWWDQDGQVVSYGQVREGIREAVEQYTYSYRMVLAPRDGQASPELYREYLADKFDRYYIIEHANTQHAHVHIIGFRNKTLQRQQLREGQQHLSRMVAQEREQRLERGHGLGL